MKTAQQISQSALNLHYHVQQLVILRGPYLNYQLINAAASQVTG